MSIQKGKVWIIGAGPGDPELITLKGARLLRSADVVLADRLVSPELLHHYTAPHARIIPVGKQCGRGPSTPQSKINELMVQHALEGSTVARLKGGDVSVFSNVLDELQTLAEHHIPYEIVPGITAASGAAAYAGIPLTARGHANAVRFVTAYSHGSLSENDWKELAATDDTLVFYMSSAPLADVRENLTRQGIQPDKLIAVIEQATTPQQRITVADLYRDQQLLEDLKPASPCLLIVGRVAALHQQFAWLPNGSGASYFDQPVAAAATKNTQRITIAYGTETGHSKKLASEFATLAKRAGLTTKLVGLDQYRLSDLQKEDHFFAIMSTQGEGDPPAAAKKFYDHIHNNGFRIDGVKFGVLALGDTAYPLFCKAGADVDLQLDKLGGKRIVPLQKCDADYEDDAAAWFASALQQLSVPATATPTVPAVRKKSGKQHYEGKVLSVVNLNDEGSEKQTFHIELSAEGVDYQPGDALGVVPENQEHIVKNIFNIINIGPDRIFAFRGEQHTAYDLLRKKLNISHLPERVVRRYAELVGQEIPVTRISLHNLLKIYPPQTPGQAEQLFEFLEPVTPRLYSIASSPEAHAGELHLTVALDRYSVDEELRHGLCSGYLSNLAEGDPLPFYIHRNESFRLPAADQDVIMIGPGTGIAPFRGFLAHRDATGATGRNWLFFGAQHFVTDFLYQTEIQAWLGAGLLTRVDVAFSRDQPHKVYVQHKMMQQGRELYEWINGGASVYVCGQKQPMSVDVEQALVTVIERFGGRSAAETEAFLLELKAQGRYVQDVY